nr:MAG TPA: Transcriptional regulator/DNA Complex factor, DNA, TRANSCRIPTION-DNA complex.65A [Caudoviricetes sp.]
MRYTTRINNVRALEWGINMTQAALFDLINECASWASTVTINGVTFYWVSRQLVIEELPLVFRKEDAVYRTLKVLEEKGLVETAKMDGRDYVRITPEGAKWNSHDVPETEPRENSRNVREKNRNPRENSRNSSGKNPTDKDINNQPTNQGTNQFGAPARDPAPREPSSEIPKPPPAKPEKFDAWAVLSDMGVERKHFDAWMQARKRKRLSSPIDEVALGAFLREIGKVGLTAHDAARMCAEKGWGSIEANWDCFKQRAPQRGNTYEHQSSAEQYAQEQAARMRPQIAAMFAAKREKRDD